MYVLYYWLITYDIFFTNKKHIPCIIGLEPASSSSADPFVKFVGRLYPPLWNSPSPSTELFKFLKACIPKCAVILERNESIVQYFAVYPQMQRNIIRMKQWNWICSRSIVSLTYVKCGQVETWRKRQLRTSDSRLTIRILMNL